MMKPRALIVDDHEGTRYVLRRILEEECDIVGEAEDGNSGLEAAERLRPDLIVLDISMPVMGGFEAARHLKDRLPEVLIIITSQYTASMYVEEAFNVGAKAYVTKGAAATELIPAVKEVLAGNIFCSREAQPR
jgi:DNA-binding NarL/FixJ family response regulator